MAAEATKRRQSRKDVLVHIVAKAAELERAADADGHARLADAIERIRREAQAQLRSDEAIPQDIDIIGERGGGHG